MSRRWCSTLRAVLVAGALASGALAVPAQAQGVLAARVNGQGISVEEVESNFNEYLKEKGLHLLQVRNPERMKQMKRAVLDLIIERELMTQEASRQGIVVTPEEVEEAYAGMGGQFKTMERFELRLAQEGYTPESYREHLRKLTLARKYAAVVESKAERVSDAEVHEFYESNPEQFSRPERVRASHILIKAPPGASPEQRAEARRKIDDLLAQAKSGADFADLARTHSEDYTKQYGGELDPITRGQMVKAFEDVAFALKPGEISDVVETPSGFHIIRVQGHDDAILITEDQARERVRQYLQTQRGEQAVKREAERLREAGKIEMLLPY